MIIYNVTINIDESVHDQWLNWMQTKHIQDMLNTGCFKSARLVKVLVDEDMGGVTYSVQYLAETKEALADYKENHAPHLRNEGLQLFADKMLAFRTDLEIISEHE
ncbi:DUF4286 family protein [Flavobacterium sp. CBA20B-1]|uniref:DUF4286 family protein n=1 Tax=Paenimyroides aestuarii TaxID=2968490 RepID=A0ABY5NW98_9FLAO|nr:MULTISPECIES: DUF4286 family protein [Flavobacteriaceae]UUV22647.1 DUF4286 family protein [Paenimyroides aestuarii]WCM40993.1 DUF4286 family protein [Flavobacterium sp. CBA20B-1]